MKLSVDIRRKIIRLKQVLLAPRESRIICTTKKIRAILALQTHRKTDTNNNWVATQLTYQHLGQLGIKWEFSHDGAQLCQVAIIVQGRQVVQQLQGSHQGLRGGRVHEVKVDKIVDTEFF